MKEINNYKVLIVDDEFEARMLLRTFVEELETVEVVGEASNAEEALFKIIKHYPDLILLDVNMPGISGLEFVSTLRKANIDIPVVFVSAYKRYALEAIQNGVYDFLLKPVSRIEIKSIIEKYIRRGEKDLSGKLREVLDSIKEENKIRINSRHSYILVNPGEIVYCQADGGSTNIHLNNNKIEVSNSTLLQLEQIVNSNDFYRLGRSYLVNKKYVRSLNKSNKTCVLEENGNVWKLSSSAKSIKEFLLNGFNYA